MAPISSYSLARIKKRFNFYATCRFGNDGIELKKTDRKVIKKQTKRFFGKTLYEILLDRKKIVLQFFGGHSQKKRVRLRA